MIYVCTYSTEIIKLTSDRAYKLFNEINISYNIIRKCVEKGSFLGIMYCIQLTVNILSPK